MALRMLVGDRRLPGDLAAALEAAVSRVATCPACGFFRSRQAPCAICDDPRRDATLLCVVEQAADVLPIERSGAFQGIYHVLGGRLSPLDGVGPEDLRIASLVDRVRMGKPGEVVLALSADVEGEATANYLAGLIAPMGIAISRLAQGLPAGGGLDNADALTLARAIAGRTRAS